MLEDFCHERGFPIYEIYADDGYSGLNFNRPAFSRLLEDIDSGKVNLVITKDLSRLGRDYIQTGYYTDVYFSRKRVRYIAVNDGIDTNRDDNDIAPFKNILNDMYAKDLSRKVKSAKRQRAYKGYYISAQAPYGYKVDPTNRNRLIVDEEAAAVVKEIFRLSLAGNSLSQISRILTARQIVTPGVYKAQNGDTRFSRYQQGKDSLFGWCYQTVRAILRDQVYTGDMVNHKVEVINYKTKERARVPKEQRIVVTDRHEPLVSREDYERVQTLISLRHRPKKHNFDNVFKDLTFCAECGHRMTLMMKPLNAGSTPLIRCTHHYTNPEDCKHNHAIYYEDLYGEVLKRVRSIASKMQSGELLERIQKQRTKRVKTDKLIAEQAKASKRLTVLKRIIKKLYEDFAADLLEPDSYHSMLTEYTNEQKQITARLAVIEAELGTESNDEKNVQKLKAVLDEYLNIETLTANMLNQLIERIEIGHAVKVDGCRQQEITIVYRFISADVYMSTGQGVLGGNMWAYCGNNPVNRYEVDGKFWNIVVGAVLGTVVGAVTAAINGQNVLVGAAAGLVSGTIAGATLGVGLAVAAGASAAIGTGATAVIAGLGFSAAGGAFGSVVGEIINEVGNGQELNGEAIAREAALGAIFNTVGFGLGSLSSMAFKGPNIVGKGIIQGMKTSTQAMSGCEKAVAMYTSAMFVNTPQAVTSFALSYTKPQTNKGKKSGGGKTGIRGSFGRTGTYAMLY